MSTPESATRLRDLEAEAFRTGRTLAEHGEQLHSIEQRQTTAFANIDSLADAIGAPGDRTITQRLDGIDTRLDGLEGRVDGIDTKLDQILELLRKP
ncbi:hypothetical protein ACIRLA_46570 [Streptomyces sp. NPDC102364]|uniref:hypothetical protein n=1 Tax=Streptomyces sp. NPDC102364 TaxID=3366161 RepID=UPI0037FE3CBC